MTPTPDLFTELCRTLNATPDKRGFLHTACPGCGRERKHFALFITEHETLRGSCVACGHTMRQREVVDYYLGGQAVSIPVIVRKPKRKAGEPAWKARASDFQFTYTSAPDVLKLWNEYKPIPADRIIAWGFGVGVLPRYASQCQHRRLTVPIYQNGQVVSWRTRAIDCDCPRWLSPLGHPQVLYNGARLLAFGDRHKCNIYHLADATGPRTAHGQTLVIVENPVDARWIELAWNMPAVATLGISNWRSEWTQAVKMSGAQLAIVAFDHDLPGNGGSTEEEHAYMESEWRVKHNTNIVPISRGPWLASELARSGIEATCYTWPTGSGPKDIGEVISCQTQTSIA